MASTAVKFVNLKSHIGDDEKANFIEFYSTLKVYRMYSMHVSYMKYNTFYDHD